MHGCMRARCAVRGARCAVRVPYASMRTRWPACNSQPRYSTAMADPMQAMPDTRPRQAAAVKAKGLTTYPGDQREDETLLRSAQKSKFELPPGHELLICYLFGNKEAWVRGKVNHVPALTNYILVDFEEQPLPPYPGTLSPAEKLCQVPYPAGPVLVCTAAPAPAPAPKPKPKPLIFRPPLAKRVRKERQILDL